MQTLLLAAYCSVLIVLCTYGAHRALLVYQCWLHRRRIQVGERRVDIAEDALPTVTVQLPIYNEATVAARLIEATGKLDYPAHKLEIQVLDDSSDETVRIAREAVEALVARGIDAQHVRRPNRHGYKAGALDFGLKTAKGELVAIFDADFVPQADFLRQVVGHFQDLRIGMVQTRWGHMNRDQSLFTQVQALMLDGHHMVENRARFGAGHYFNFSGTGGIWRRAAIDAAGGWQHDTLTEDLDLSYRAQMAGYRFVYRSDVLTPSELPEDMSAFRAQQFRWAKGTVQTARKLLKRVASSKLSLSQRVEACFHMLPHFAYPMMVLLSLLLLPALIYMPATDLRTMLLIDLPLCFGATGSIATFYITAEVAQGRSGWSAAKRLPALIALGAGLAPHLTAAVLDGLTKMAGEFVRTPKRGTVAGRYFQHAKLPLAEMALCLVSAASVVASLKTSHYFATPFAALFMLGYGYVASQVLLEQLGRPVPAPDRISAPTSEAEAEDLPGLAA
jgi:cellulose synthase/poly-beta-1,6-N-acetylglucosamine synthase-like glycosyltransferase